MTAIRTVTRRLRAALRRLAPSARRRAPATLIGLQIGSPS